MEKPGNKNWINRKFLVVACAAAITFLLPFCAKDPYPVDPESGYPSDVGQIFLGKCATSGCHNDASNHAAAGLNLSSWEKLFKGGRFNAAVIPYRPDQSILFFSVNTFSELGPMSEPTMPAGHDPLSREEVVLIRDWIASGAPNRDGEIAFSGDPTRSKIYVANQGCDMVTVFDAETQLAMRCIDIGVSFSTEAPHDMMVSPDGQYWYVTFFAGTLLQKYSTVTDQLVGQLDLGVSGWHSMAISADSHYGAVSKWDPSGRVALVDLTTMTLVQMMQGFSYPHGCAFSQNGDYMYVVNQQGNYIYKLDITTPSNPQVEMIPLHTGGIPSNNGLDKPYVIRFSPDYQKYFVPCQGTNEMRVFSAANDSLLAVIPTNGVPQLIDFSVTTPYAFITSMVDTNNANTESCVNIINWQTNTLVSTVYPGFQDRGLVVDDANGVVYIGNRNVDPGGPAPHHTTSCAGKNGDVTLISIQTLQVIENWKAEVSVDPYCLTIRR